MNIAFSPSKYDAMLSDLHKYYADRYDYLLLDGIFCEQRYASAPLKIVTLLAEPYGYDSADGIVDVRRQSEVDIVGFPAIKTTLALSALYWLVFEYAKSGTKISYDEMPSLFSRNNPKLEEQRESLLLSGWVNGKKIPNNQSQADAGEVYEHTYEHAPMLAKQLEAMAPDLIIVAHQQVFDGLINAGVLGTGVQAERDRIQVLESGAWLLFTTHPSRWMSYDKLYGLYELIVEALSARETAPEVIA